MKNIIFFGNERLATGIYSTNTPTLKGLINNGYTVKAVVINHESPSSRKSRELEIQSLAKANNIPVLAPKNLGRIQEQLKSYAADIAVLVAYGRIIPESIINSFKYGIINLHPSLLPQYRGPTPIEQAILDDAPKTGVSIMKLTPQMDAGPIYLQRSVKLSGNEEKNELASQLLLLGSQLLIDNLPKILSGQLKPRRQPHPERVTYTKKLTKSDGQIDWNKPAAALEREVRAYLGWPSSQTNLNGTDVTITKVEVRDQGLENMRKPGQPFLSQDNELSVQAKNGLLVIKSLRPSGRNEMSGLEFSRGYLK